MAYSKITSVEVTNFMVYTKAKLVFDDSNIVNIKGYNSSGKSTMLKAIGVCLTNMFPRSQTKLIRHGEDYFRIVVNFSDGVSILRDKYANGQSLYEMYKNGEKVFTTMEGRKLAKVDDVPEIIKAYLGLCNTSYGCLNYQSRQDKLWLVETTGSENYSTLNEILKSEELSRANALINSDKNKLSSEITEIESSLQAVKLERLNAEGYTEELLHALEERESIVKELRRRELAIKRLFDIVAELQGIQISPEVSKIDTARLSAVSSLCEIISELKGIGVAPTIPKIESTRLQRVSEVSSLMLQLSEAHSKQVKAEIPLISLERSTKLSKVVASLNTYSESISVYRDLKAGVSETKAVLDKAVSEAESQGVHFVKCDSCGSYTEVKEGVTK